MVHFEPTPVTGLSGSKKRQLTAFQASLLQINPVFDRKTTFHLLVSQGMIRLFLAGFCLLVFSIQGLDALG